MELRILSEIISNTLIPNNATSNTTHNDEPSNSGHGSFLSAKTLIAILILLIYTIATPIFEKFHFHYVHESGICMILGFLVGLVSMLINPLESFSSSLQFDDEVFFNFILPPIIFAAGYNLKKKSFFKYFFYIFIFGVLGTIITFGVVAPLTYLSNSMNLFGLTFEGESLKFSLKEILLFSSVIVATDTVAALTFVKEEQEPKLFSILFGEGVLNDAVCIVLYRIIKMFNFQNEEFTTYTLASMFGSFLLLFLISTILGIFGGLSCSLFLKKLRYFKLGRAQETSIIIFFAFITYSCTEILGYSPIISLLFCGIFMSHYSFYNLSFQAREESTIVSKIMSNIAEGFVFTYLGLSSVSISSHSISISFIIWVLIFVLLGRIAGIYGISGFLKLIRCPNFKIKEGDKGIMCFAGSIRGAIAFGLAISIESKNAQHRGVLISTTLVLVFFTTIFFGALMPSVVKYFKQKDISQDKKVSDRTDRTDKTNIEKNNDEYNYETYTIQRYDNPDDKLNTSKDDLTSDKISHKIKGLWRRFDNTVMKPFFIGDWPYVKDDHDEISRKIISVFEEHQRRKFKNKELKDMSTNSRRSAEKIEALLVDPSIKKRKSDPKI